MARERRSSWCRAAAVVVAVCAAAVGCTKTCEGYRPSLLHPHAPVPVVPDQPRELSKMVMPDYVIEPPDVLQIDAVRVIPKPPYRIEPLDTLAIQVTDALPNQPIAGLYVVEPDGTINLGFAYGSVKVVDLTVEKAQAAVEAHLKKIIQPGFQVSVSPADTRGRQIISGPHLVKQDGKVGLGSYGNIPVAGLTLEQAKAAIEAHLSQYLLNPEVVVDVAGFNSKVYYVITDNATYGEGVFRQPITGNETVLDAVSTINGLPAFASKKRIWIARPTPGGCDRILPVDWVGITKCGQAATNYQILPGDRVYVDSQRLVVADNVLLKVIAPIERIFGFALLGNSTVLSLRNQGGGGGFFNNNNTGGVINP